MTLCFLFVSKSVSLSSVFEGGMFVMVLCGKKILQRLSGRVLVPVLSHALSKVDYRTRPYVLLTFSSNNMCLQFPTFRMFENWGNTQTFSCKMQKPKFGKSGQDYYQRSLIKTNVLCYSFQPKGVELLKMIKAHFFSALPCLKFENIDEP